MIELTEPQVWTLIAVFTAVVFGLFTMISTVFVRILRTEIGGLRAEMNGRFEAIDARFEAVNVKIVGLDRDVQLLMRREFGIDRD